MAAIDANRDGRAIKPVGPSFGPPAFCLIPVERLLVIELAIAFVAAGVDLAPVDGVLDGAAVSWVCEQSGKRQWGMNGRNSMK